ncbi:hypothetical protein LMG31506_05602 [Cupriavidus yeoncheonensis]|uniref:BON domain-containing protein n=1 Tax=Cupriavidus yeoncheonensis TaxID=1462994 RepID=A0A916IZM0_9BURK|nr:hypothetical protein [Cupriavidus yeoncheonensis]CAG2156130.1 hypothetical protein LMG31506_05602 [Cupriavidus yeoncheonensis]
MPEYKSRLTDYHYGGHSAVSDDRGQLAAADVRPASHDNHPVQQYVPSGANEPVGVERYGMYGVAPGPVATGPANRVFAEPVPRLYDGDGVRTDARASEARLLERFEMEIADVVDPGIVKAEIVTGICTLRGTVRDAVARRRIEAIAGRCLPECAIQSELLTSTSQAPQAPGEPAMSSAGLRFDSP